MNTHKQFVLLSGGLDSTTVLYHAINNAPDSFSFPSGDKREAVEAVSIDYGQRHRREMHYAANICSFEGIAHHILKMPYLLAGSMLTDTAAEIPEVSYAELPDGISPTYVPFRNGLFISMLAAHAQKWVMGDASIRKATIYIGAHAEDAANDAYPDCSRPFLQAMQDAVRIGTYQTVTLEAPLMGLQKSEIVTMGEVLDVPFGATWSCYKGGDFHCGKCPTCRARKEAFVKAGIKDPTHYAA